MAKTPYFPFYTGDWLRDPGQRMLTLKEKGAWIEFLCAMHDGGPRGEITGTIAGLSRLLGVDDEEGYYIIHGLVEKGVCDAVFANGSENFFYEQYGKEHRPMLPDVPFCPVTVTLISRRMKREEAEKEYEREKKRKQRASQDCPDNVPDVSPECPPALSSSTSSSCPKGHNKNTPKQVSDDTRTVFDNWKTKPNLIHHRVLTDTHAKHINARLKDYTVEEVCGSIDNYSSILADPDYMLNYKWKLEEFMQRSFEKFLTENDPFSSYPKERHNGGKTDASNGRTESQRPGDYRAPSLRS